MQSKFLAIAAAAALTFSATAAYADTLADVKAKGYLQCGVTGGVAGFSAPDANNEWAGLEVDFCRAVAAAIFNDASKVRYTPLTSQERFTALSAGEIDILSRTTTWTMSRDTQLGIKFVGTMYYDGQGFMVRKADEHQVGAGPVGRRHLHRSGHHDRTERRRLFRRPTIWNSTPSCSSTRTKW